MPKLLAIRKILVWKEAGIQPMLQQPE